jgi:hypothetical protein
LGRARASISRAVCFCDLQIRSALSKKSQFERNYFLLVRELASTAPGNQRKTR